MNRTRLFACVALAFWATQTVAQESSAQRVPKTFESIAAAEKYAKRLFAGGSSDLLKVANGEVLVLRVYGSGVPDIAIAAYRTAKDGWALAAEWLPETIEAHIVFVSDGDIVIRGEKTKKRWVLLKSNGQTS